MGVDQLFHTGDTKISVRIQEGVSGIGNVRLERDGQCVDISRAYSHEGSMVTRRVRNDDPTILTSRCSIVGQLGKPTETVGIGADGAVEMLEDRAE